MSTKNDVLAFLMKHAPERVSGEYMANELTISRTAIWKAINQLRKSSFSIESNSQGYLYKETNLLSIPGINANLCSTAPTLTIKKMANSESTMKDAKLAILDQTPAHTLLVADMQKFSVGRFGRPFFAKPGAGIYMSLILHPNQKFSEITNYTIITAVAVVRALNKLLDISPKIKWVNDIYINDKKVCGILTEAISDMEAGQISSIIIGIGLNFSIKQIEFPDELQSKVTSLFPNGQYTVTRNELIAEIWNQFYKILVHSTNEQIIDEYKKYSLVLGKKVSFMQNKKEYTGLAETINLKGELVVRLVDGTKKLLCSGEVSLQAIY